MNTATVSRGTWVCIPLSGDCAHKRLHHPDEDGLRGRVTGIEDAGDHWLFVLYRGRARASRFPFAPDLQGFLRLPLGRHYRLDVLEVIPEPA